MLWQRCVCSVLLVGVVGIRRVCLLPTPNPLRCLHCMRCLCLRPRARISCCHGVGCVAVRWHAIRLCCVWW